MSICFTLVKSFSFSSTKLHNATHSRKTLSNVRLIVFASKKHWRLMEETNLECAFFKES